MKALAALLFLVLLFALPASSGAQDAGNPDTAPPGSTVITSDELRSDQINHTSVFTGNVVVIGQSFTLTCQEMTVNFNTAGKIDNIVANGNVVITQPDRVSHSGQAQYFRDEDKFVLTDQPEIIDHKNKLTAPRIIILRTDKTLKTEGGRSRMIITNSGASAATAPTPPAP